jgi:hypothetical protein
MEGTVAADPGRHDRFSCIVVSEAPRRLNFSVQRAQLLIFKRLFGLQKIEVFWDIGRPRRCTLAICGPIDLRAQAAARSAQRADEPRQLQFRRQELRQTNRKSSNPVATRFRNQQRALSLRISRGDKTPLELFSAGVRGWGAYPRQRLDDGKPVEHVA